MINAPRILIFLLSGNWVGISRLPKALTDADFHVATLSPVGSYLSLTRYAQRHVTMPSGAHPVEVFVRVASEAKPDLIIPGCDTTVLFLQNFERAYRNQTQNAEFAALLDLVRRSLGDPKSYAATSNKIELLAKAREAKVCTPDYTELRSSADAKNFAKEYGYPIVLKGEQGSGGSSVRICNTPKEIDARLAELEAIPLVMPQVAKQRPRVVAQQHIVGVPALHAFCADAGKLLEYFQAFKEQRHPGPTGPSSVLRFLEHAEMNTAAHALIEHLGFTGFANLDFMIEDATQRAYLIEFNPRPCAVGHIGQSIGRNLAHALWCQMTHQPYVRTHVENPPPSIALFPQEWQRDPQSPALTTMPHDMPHDDPSLLRALMP